MASSCCMESWPLPACLCFFLPHDFEDHHRSPEVTAGFHAGAAAFVRLPPFFVSPLPFDSAPRLCTVRINMVGGKSDISCDCPHNIVVAFSFWVCFGASPCFTQTLRRRFQVQHSTTDRWPNAYECREIKWGSSLVVVTNHNASFSTCQPGNVISSY